MTVLEVIQRSAEFLSKKGVESPRLQVELLLAHLLNLPRMKLYLNFERVLTDGELEKLRLYVKRRGQREPLQHIIGSVNFCGLEFAVNHHVLIPRPETELLAERAWNFLRSQDGATRCALDFGTGSGCLAVMLAEKCPGVEIHALDISSEALEVARQNAVRHNVRDRIVFYQSDGFGALPTERQFDLIVTNPPYIPSGEIPSLQIEVRNHDPKLALDGGAAGLRFYEMLAEEAPSFLAPAGRLMAEFGEGQTAALREIFERQKWIVEAVERDYTQRERFIIVRRSKETTI